MAGVYLIQTPPPADLEAFILEHQNDPRLVILPGQYRNARQIVNDMVDNSAGNLAINRVAQLVGPIWWGGNKALRKTIVDYFKNVWTFMVWDPRSGTFVPYASMPLKENRTIDDHVNDRHRYLLTKQGAGPNNHPDATIENINEILDAAVARFAPANLDGLGEDQNFDDDATLPFNDETENQLAAREEGRGRGRGAAPANRRRESGRSSSNERHQTFDSDSDGNLSPEGSDTDDSFPGRAPPASDSESETVSGLLDDSSDENSIRSRKKHLRRVGDYRSTANASNVSSYDDEFDVSTNEDGDGGGDGEDNENDTNIANETINLVSDVSDEELSYDDNFIGQSNNVKQRATATGQGKGASATSTGNEQHELIMASLKAKELEIKRLESVLEKRGELTLRPDNPEFDFFFIDYHDDDISTVLERKVRLIKILKFQAYGTY